MLNAMGYTPRRRPGMERQTHPPKHTYTRTRGERLEGTAPQALQEGPLASRTARMNRRRKQRKVDKCRGAESEPCTNRNNNPKCTVLGKS